MIKHFWGSYLALAIALAIALIFWGVSGFYVVALLALLEVSLSFDNAVVNAKALLQMDLVWRRRFIVWGIPIAVFGMRFLIPVALVWAVSSMTLWQTFAYAFNDPQRYAEELKNGEDLIFAFGGAFLLMVAQSFYFDDSRKVYWFDFWENNRFVQIARRINTISLIFSALGGIILLYVTKSAAIGIAYFFGVVLYEIIHRADALFSAGGGVRNGAIGFIYLETLDASFSLDGVVGAFALSENIFVIMLGLGVGALFVRSITLFFVRKGTLAEYRYLEHGAYYAIFALALIMLAKIFWHVEEFITGTISAAFILLAFWRSVVANRKSLE
ncbi:MAG: DUF475 domain-containing protein [Helicobacteraceae bacterium]|jgi:hypothetical protein|nr:DUF475 domain-containing protein [Helicobacteraceae bacterium]